MALEKSRAAPLVMPDAVPPVKAIKDTLRLAQRAAAMGKKFSLWVKGRQNRTLKSPDPKNMLTTPVGRLIEKLSYPWFLGIAITVILGSAIFFTVTQDYSCSSRVCSYSFGESIYLSVVTFTSLGYGELLPIGVGRLVACIDVTSGLSLVALVIGKVASERQYSMLLLLHTSDCQRRLKEFSADLQRAGNGIDDCCKSIDERALARSVKAASNLLLAVNNYLVFHLNQTLLPEFGNSSALLALCRAMHELQRSCGNAYREKHVSEKTSEVCLKVSRRLIDRARLIVEFQTNAGGVVPEAAFRVVRAMEGDLDQLEEWSSTNVTAAMRARVLAELPKTPLGTWAKGTHKQVAKALGLSNSQVIKCVDDLVAVKKVTVGRPLMPTPTKPAAPFKYLLSVRRTRKRRNCQKEGDESEPFEHF